MAGPLSALGFFNSVINPVIYCWWHTNFRKNAIRIISKRLEHSTLCGCCFLSYSSNSNKLSNEATSQRTTDISSISNLSSQIASDQIHT